MLWRRRFYDKTTPIQFNEECLFLLEMPQRIMGPSERCEEVRGCMGCSEGLCPSHGRVLQGDAYLSSRASHVASSLACFCRALASCFVVYYVLTDFGVLLAAFLRIFVLPPKAVHAIVTIRSNSMAQG